MFCIVGLAGLGEREAGFELKWRAVAEGRVETLGIVNGVDEDANETPCIFEVLEAAAIDFFGFEGLHETLSFGIVVRIAGPAHADGDIVPGEALAIFCRGILHATIRVMDEAGRHGLAIGKSVIQRLRRQARHRDGEPKPSPPPCARSRRE